VRKPKINHNSPQNPKIYFVHSRVVQPQPLTLGPSGRGEQTQNPNQNDSRLGVAETENDVKPKTPSSKGWGFDNMPAIT
jgi:hypothetical protein